MCVRSSACMCMQTYARMRRMHPSVRVRGRARGGRASTECVTMYTHAGMQACMHVCMMYVCMSAYIDSLFECACARVLCACECALACACVGVCGRTLAVLCARLLDVHPYVHECECMHVHKDPCTGAHIEPVSGCKCACARLRVRVRVRAQRERRKRARAHVYHFVHKDRWTHLSISSIFIYRCICVYIYMYGFICCIHVSIYMCVCI
jgi:hypothetical protein